MDIVVTAAGRGDASPTRPESPAGLDERIREDEDELSGCWCVWTGKRAPGSQRTSCICQPSVVAMSLTVTPAATRDARQASAAVSTKLHAASLSSIVSTSCIGACLPWAGMPLATPAKQRAGRVRVPGERRPGACRGRGHVALLLGSLLAGFVGLAPSGRVRADAIGPPVGVWTGTEVLIRDHRFNPRTKTGRLMAGPGALVDGQAVVWTGSQLLEWGRCCAADQTLLPEGAAYDPSTDRWSPLETAGAPRLGRVLAADWSGTELLLWGEPPPAPVPQPTSTATSGTGTSASTSAGDTTGAVGAAYDPARRTWRPLAAGGPPPDAGPIIAPIDHAWTSGRWLLWGLDGPTRDRHGWRYELETDRWTRVAPPPVDGLKSAVWTGDRWLLWGQTARGQSSFGAAYDPPADAWTLIAAPPAGDWSFDTRFVWAGDRVLAFTFGATKPHQYLPQLDRWLPRADAPPGVARPGGGFPLVDMAVWTGHEVFLSGHFPGSEGQPISAPDQVYTPPDLSGLVLLAPATGGRISAPGGESWLDVPPGASDRETFVQLAILDAAAVPEPPAGDVLARPALQVLAFNGRGPETPFASAAMLGMCLSADEQADAHLFSWATWRASAGWSPLPTTVDDQGCVVASLDRPRPVALLRAAPG